MCRFPAQCTDNLTAAATTLFREPMTRVLPRRRRLGRGPAGKSTDANRSPQIRAGVRSDSAAPDARLVDAIADADSGALAELYDRYSPAVWRLACVTVGTAGAAAVVADVFVELWRAPTKGAPLDDGGPMVCRLLDAVMQHDRVLAARAGNARIDRLSRLTPPARAALLLVTSGANREHAANALGVSPATVNALLRTALDGLSERTP